MAGQQPARPAVVITVDGHWTQGDPLGPPPGRWYDELCGCFNNFVPSCLCSYFCPCVLAGQVAAAVGLERDVHLPPGSRPQGARTLAALSRATRWHFEGGSRRRTDVHQHLFVGRLLPRPRARSPSKWHRSAREQLRCDVLRPFHCLLPHFCWIWDAFR